MLLKLLLQSHLPEKTCREIVDLFAEDYTATEIAALTGVSRVTVNHLLKLLRRQIVLHCGEKAVEATGRPISRFSAERPGTAAACFGLLAVDGKLFTEELVDPITASWDQPVQNFRAQREMISRLGRDGGFSAVADFQGRQLYRLSADPGKTTTVDQFWAETCSRLRKFRGLHRNSLHLHVKESEFRFNNRDGNMPRLLSLLLFKAGESSQVCR